MSSFWRRALIASVVIAAPALAAPTTVIHAGHLMTEPGKPILEQQSLIIENGKITAIQPGYVAGDQVVDLSSAWVMPGLIDMHSHISVAVDIHSDNPFADFMPAFIGRPTQRLLQALTRGREVLHQGFTTIRNLGDPASVTYDLRNAINAGILDGPRIIAVEPQFGVPGGDYEAFAFGERDELDAPFRSRGTCSGATDCERAVRSEIRRGADVIKARLAYFGADDPAAGPMETPAEFNAIVATAHRLHRKVATHSAGQSAANQIAIEAGTDSIEHGPLSDANIAAMVKHGTAYTPTLITTKVAMESGKLPMPPDTYLKTQESVTKAHKAGVMILFGSDLPVAPQKDIPREFLLLQAAGLSPAEALRTATVNAAQVLDRADTLGTLAVGKLADMIALPSNPLEDLSVMARVGFVMKDGKVVRNDLGATAP